MLGLLNPLEYMTHTAQLEQVSALDMWGNVSTTSVVTISCLAYQDTVEDGQTGPVGVFKRKNWMLLIPNTVAVTIGNHIKSVVDDLGASVIPNASVIAVEDYHHWEYRSRFRILMLDISNNG